MDDLIRLYNNEFPDDMPCEKISEKLDTMNSHPRIQDLRSFLYDLNIRNSEKEG